MGDLKPYPEYKDSGIEWIGNIPEHWNVLSGRACFYEKYEPNTGLKEKTVLSLSYGKIVIKPEEKLHGLVPESFETYQIVNPGDIVIRPTDLQNDWNSLRFGLAQNRGIITSAYLCFQTTEKIDPDYGHLLLHTYDLNKVFYGLGSGLRQNLDWTDFKYLSCLVPPISEQKAIVRYHRWIEQQLLNLINAKRRLIDFLNEQKQVIISRAVARGLDPNVRLKPSGIEWLGDVPEHWEVMLNQRIFKETIRPHRGQPEIPLSLSQKDGLIATSEMQERSLKTSTYDNWKVTFPGDLVLNSFKAHLGVFFASTVRGIISFNYSVYAPRQKLETKYFELLYHTSVYRTIYGGRSDGIMTGLRKLYNQNFYNVQSIVPPIHEQKEIISFVEKESKRFEDLIKATRREIDLIREYQARVTADVTTGKVDVRNIDFNKKGFGDFIGVSEKIGNGNKETI